MNFPLTKDFMSDIKNLVGCIQIDETKINLDKLARKFEKGLIEIVPSLLIKDGKFEFVEFSFVVSQKKVVK